jgi:F420-dependent oxidoreductase-like protein
MRLNVHLVRFPWNGGPSEIAPGLTRVAEATEQVGANGLSFMDHYFGPPARGPANDPMLEGYTALGFVAAITDSVRLRLLVSGVTYRHPGLLAKIVTTLDVLSGGRAELGLGAAWYAREHRGLGVPFPPLPERFGRLEETLQICLQMWGTDDGPFNGRYYQLAETLCSPAPVSRPRPRIIVGGGGELRTLSLVARYADTCNLFATSASAVQHKLDVLKRHCTIVGRTYEELSKTVVYNGELLTRGDYRRFVEEMTAYSEMGIDEVFVIPVGPRPEQWIETHCGAVVATLAALGP